MYSDLSSLGLGLVVIWLLVLSYLFWKEKSFLKSLFPKEGNRDIRQKFGEVTNALEEFAKKEKRDLSNIRKVALVRFNPYEDTGGDISFSLALLNSENSGIVITSLHSRAGTRIFAKDVIKGKAGKYKFAEEEEKVIKEAIIKT